jgi:hypothetical protein
MNEVTSNFVHGPDGLRFVISLNAGDVAASIGSCSRYEAESRVLIAASSGFLVDSVDETPVTSHVSRETFTVSRVNLTHSLL